MNAKLKHGIYFLEGCTMRGEITISQSLDQYDDTTNLRHHIMGNMSENGMEMSKHGLFGGDVTRQVKPG